MTLFGECGYDCWERGRDCDHGDPVDDWDDGPGFDWDDGPEPPPSRRVMTIETTGDRL